MRIPGLFLVLGISLSSMGQAIGQRTLTVRVLDAETKRPVRDATVWVGDQQVTKTNAVGFFQLTVDTVKQITLRHPAFEVSRVVLPEALQFSTLLSPKWNVLEPIPVRSEPINENVISRTDSTKPYLPFVGGSKQFYAQMSTSLSKLSPGNFHKDSVVRIQFAVDGKASVSRIRITGASDSVRKVITAVLTTPGNWEIPDPTYPMWPFSVVLQTKASVVEEPPHPVNGMQAFYFELGSNMKYPKEALKKDIQGRVIVSFTVEKDGSLTECKVVKGIGYGCDEEAVRLISIASKWVPARQGDKVVRSKYSLPVIFRLN